MGPLKGIRIIELAGIGPAPMCAMLLADMGATVLRIDRPEPAELGIKRPFDTNLVLRNRKTVSLDLKNPQAIALVLRLLESSDGLIEGFRPGVMERLGLAPDVCLARNPRLVYGRATGWGQSGPLAMSAGHDLNFIAVTGVLNAIGRAGQPPTVPLNLIGDYGGGSLYLAMGMLAALIESGRSGLGQVVDAAIVDGTASLATSLFGMAAAGMLNPQRGSNILDSGAPFYDVYQCRDGGWLSVAAIEGKFYQLLLREIDADVGLLAHQMDTASWPATKETLAGIFKTRDRDDWVALFAGSDACVAPVLDWQEAAQHPHLRERETLIDVAGVVQPAPAPRFSRTPPAVPQPPAPVTADNTRSALADWLSPDEIAGLFEDGIIQ